MYRIPMYAHQHSHAFEIEIRERERAHTQGRKTMCLQEVSRSHTTKQPATTPSHIVFAMQFYTQFTVIYSSFIVIRVIVSDTLTFPSCSVRFSLPISSLARTLKTETHLIVEKVGMVWLFQRHLFYLWQMFESIIIFDGFACLYRQMVVRLVGRSVGRSICRAHRYTITMTVRVQENQHITIW